jgi:hypothetical protein
MEKPKAQKEWQIRNADKVRAYTAKYLEDKVKATVTLTKEVAEKIDKLKPPTQTYGGWIREQIEEIVKNSTTL